MAELHGNELNQTILDNIPYLVWLKDTEGNYIHVNKAFADSYNLKPEDIIGKSDFDFCPPDKAREFRNSDEQVIISKKRQFIEQYERLDSGASNFETFKTPVFNDQGEVTGIAGISREIADNTQMEKTMHEREEQFRALLQNSSDAISSLTGRAR